MRDTRARALRLATATNPAAARNVASAMPNGIAAKLRQRASDRSLTDAEIFVVGLLPLLVGGDARAHAESQQREPEQRGQLVVVERAALAVAAHHR